MDKIIQKRNTKNQAKNKYDTKILNKQIKSYKK